VSGAGPANAPATADQAVTTCHFGVAMRSALRVLFFLLAAEVVVQGMAIAYALAGMGHWVDEDGGVVNKALFDQDNPDFPGVGGFMTHGMNGMMVIPVLALILLIVSFFAKVPGATKNAGILFGLVVLQVILGITSHGVPVVIMLHVINAFAIFSTAAVTAWRLSNNMAVDAPRGTAAV
jgi:heme A synthase